MRVIFALVAIAILVAAAVFFADNPGQVEIVWRGWQVESSVGVLVAAAIIAAVAVKLLLWLLSRIFGSPRAVLRWRRERRRRNGYRALTRGMVAVAAGDPEEARRYARRADALLAEPPLTLLLSAQAAQLGGDETAAKRFFTTMLDRPETEFLGLRGLLNQAMRDGDRTTARRLAGRAAELSPKTNWPVLSLFDLEVRDERWEAARDSLAQAVKYRIVAPAIARHHRGVILFQLSLAALTKGDRHRALALAAEAQGRAPDLAPVAAHRARLLLEDRRIARAAKAVARAWQTAPHPLLAQVYGAIWESDTPLARVARFERLAARNPGARESHIALAEAALAAQLWGEARRHLERAFAADPPPAAPIPANPTPALPMLAAGSARLATTPATEGTGGMGGDINRPSVRLCLIMARLEESEHGDLGRMRQWLDRAAAAAPDPRWVCANCGGENLDWHSLCPRCGSFDALTWRTPIWAVSEGRAGDARPAAALAGLEQPALRTGEAAAD
jgi:HemY protein